MACGSIGHHALNFEYQPSLYGLFRNEVERLTDLPAEWSRQREMLGFPSH